MSKKSKLIYCNYCGKEICMEGQQDKVSFLTVKKEWGYFSLEKDGQVHSFDICEPCYDSLVQIFAIAPEVEAITEFL